MINNFKDEESQIIIHSEESLETVNGIPFNQPLNIIIEDIIFDKIQKHVVSNLHVEMGGVIIGRVYSHNGITYVEATDIIQIDQPDATFASLKFDYKAWINIDQIKNSYFPDKNIVGWYHSHLGLGIFYSLSDISVHRIAFPEKWQFGIVVDPINQNQGVFTWGDNHNIVQSKYLLSKSIISSLVQQDMRSDLYDRIQLLKSYTEGLSGFSELQSYFTNLIDNLSKSKNSSRKSGYPHLSEVAKLLRYSNIQSTKIKTLLTRLDQFFDQEFYLSLEMLQVYFAALPENSFLIALGEWAYALVQNNTILAVNSEVIDNKIKMRVLKLPWQVERIFSLHNEIFGIDANGSCYKLIHNDSRFGYDDELTGMIIGTFSKTIWHDVGGIKGIKNICSLKNDIVLCHNNRLYSLILDNDDYFSLERLNYPARIPLIKTMASDIDGNIYLLSDSGKLSKSDSAGKKKWNIICDNIINLNEISLFTIYNSYVVILDANKIYLYFFDVEGGKYLRRYRLTSWLISRGISGLFASQNALYISSGSEAYRLVI